MSDLFLHQIASPARLSQARQTHSAVVQGCVATFSDESSRGTLWQLPSHDEWRRAMLVIGKQFALQLAGYRDQDEFASDGCRFAWDVLGKIHASDARRDL